MTIYFIYRDLLDLIRAELTGPDRLHRNSCQVFFAVKYAKLGYLSTKGGLFFYSILTFNLETASIRQGVMRVGMIIQQWNDA